VTVQLGVSTSCFREISLPESLRWAGQIGFQAVEIECPPLRGSSSWYQHSALNIAGLDGPSRDAFATALEKNGLRTAALEWRGNLLESDSARRETATEHLARLVETAATLGIAVVVVPVGRDPTMPLGDSIAEFARRARPVIEQAENSGVRLAIDTCPMVGWQFEDMPGNAAFSPELWEKLFTHVRSPAVGLALSPADLAWLGCDPLGAVTDYAEKTFHIRAQDIEIVDQRRQDCSVLRPSGGWWRYRLPGLGSIDWRRLVDRLLELRYGGALSVRHEDPVWQGGLEQVKEGLGLARRHLVQFLP
jgi:sugar phosphate isomerase/epimerase